MAGKKLLGFWIKLEDSIPEGEMVDVYQISDGSIGGYPEAKIAIFNGGDYAFRGADSGHHMEFMFKTTQAPDPVNNWKIESPQSATRDAKIDSDGWYHYDMLVRDDNFPINEWTYVRMYAEVSSTKGYFFINQGDNYGFEDVIYEFDAPNDWARPSADSDFYMYHKDNNPKFFANTNPDFNIIIDNFHLASLETGDFKDSTGGSVIAGLGRAAGFNNKLDSNMTGFIYVNDFDI